MPRLEFGPWTPDLAPILNQRSLLTATNVLRRVGGYGPIRSLAPVPVATALTARARGAIASIDDGGNAVMFAGDETKLYRFRDAGAEDISRVGGYGTFDPQRWEFGIMRGQVIATNFNDPVQIFDLVTSTLFADLAVEAPRARHLCVLEDFLVLGNIYDLELGPLTSGISWSGLGNPASWPPRDTDLAIELSSDRRVLDSEQGFVQGLVAGSEVGAIFQERAVHRMDFIGGDQVFAIRKVEPTHGLLIPGLCVPFQRGIFYLAEDGFRVFDYQTSQPIGKDRVDRFFFDDWDSTYPDRVTAVRDPDGTRIFIGYPGAGSSGGTPNRILIWDWVLGDFTLVNVTHEILSRVIDAGVTLDTLPDDTLDDLPQSLTSFDDRTATPGALRIGAFDTDHLINDFSGQQLEGELETGDLEFMPGRRSFVSGVAPLVDGDDAFVSVATLSKRPTGTDPVEYGDEAAVEEDGFAKVREDGRYHRLKFRLPNEFTVAVGADVEFSASGRR